MKYQIPAFELFIVTFIIAVSSCGNNKKIVTYKAESKTEVTLKCLIENISNKYGIQLKLNKQDGLSKNRCTFSLDQIYYKVNSNEMLTQVYIDLQSENVDISVITCHSNKVMSLLDNTLNPNDYKIIWKELSTFEYSGYNPFKYKQFELMLSKDDLSDTDNRRYRVNITYNVNN